MFEYLSLLESVIDGSKVEKAGCNPRRKLGNMTWQASIPAISAAMLMEVDPSTNLNGAVLCHDREHADTKDQSVSVLSLDTPIHWLLMRAYEQATKRFIEQARSCVTSILPRIGFAVLEEQTCALLARKTDTIACELLNRWSKGAQAILMSSEVEAHRHPLYPLVKKGHVADLTAALSTYRGLNLCIGVRPSAYRVSRM